VYSPGELVGNYCHAHVQVIIVAIDQYAESALGNREYFLNKPYGIGGRRDSIPYLWNDAPRLFVM
jgi:hypothetical protein